MVHTINTVAQQTVAAYTFDAGPNACIYTLSRHMDRLLNIFLHYFLPQNSTTARFVNDPLKLAEITNGATSAELPRPLLSALGERSRDHRVNSIIVTKVGDGPRIVEQRHSFH